MLHYCCAEINPSNMTLENVYKKKHALNSLDDVKSLELTKLYSAIENENNEFDKVKLVNNA